MKKNTQDLVNEISTTKNISQYMDSNQEEFIKKTAGRYRRQRFPDCGKVLPG